MASVDELEQTYRRIYRRLTLGVFILYGVVVVLAVTVLLGNPIKSFETPDRWGPPSRRAARLRVATVSSLTRRVSSP